MNKVQKNEAIKILKEQFQQYQHFYVINTESLTVAQISKLRKACFDKNIELKVAKNTLVQKAFEQLGSDKYKDFVPTLHGVTALMFTDNAKDPAVILSAFRDENPDSKGRPILKAAFVLSENYIGDEKLAELRALKTKEELIGELIGLLQSPLRNIISGLQNQKNKVQEKPDEVASA